jgi:hypothetical protein
MNPELQQLVDKYEALPIEPPQTWQQIRDNGLSQTARTRRSLVFDIAELAYNHGEDIATAIVKQKDEDFVIALREDGWVGMFTKATPPSPLPCDGNFRDTFGMTWLDADGKLYWRCANTLTWQLCDESSQFQKLGPVGLKSINFDLLEI